MVMSSEAQVQKIPWLLARALYADIFRGIWKGRKRGVKDRF